MAFLSKSIIASILAGLPLLCPYGRWSAEHPVAEYDVPTYNGQEGAGRSQTRLPYNILLSLSSHFRIAALHYLHTKAMQLKDNHTQKGKRKSRIRADYCFSFYILSRLSKNPLRGFFDKRNIFSFFILPRAKPGHKAYHSISSMRK
jgi:hypothetical protein